MPCNHLDAKPLTKPIFWFTCSQALGHCQAQYTLQCWNSCFKVGWAINEFQYVSDDNVNFKNVKNWMKWSDQNGRGDFARSYTTHQLLNHYSDVIMSKMASQITGITIVYLTICLGADQRKHKNSVSLAFVKGIHQWTVNSQHKWPVMRKMFPFDEIIM